MVGVLGLAVLSVSAHAENLKVAAGAGYKAPLMEVIKEYEKGGEKIDPFFGNLQQVSTQAKQTNIALIVGDKNFLATKSNLDFKEYLPLGVGKVVIAYPKGSKLTSVEDLKKSSIKRIAMFSLILRLLFSLPEIPLVSEKVLIIVFISSVAQLLQFSSFFFCLTLINLRGGRVQERAYHRFVPIAVHASCRLMIYGYTMCRPKVARQRCRFSHLNRNRLAL